VLGQRQSGSLEDYTNAVVANHEILNVELNEQDDEEPPVVVNALDNVVFFVNLTT